MWITPRIGTQKLKQRGLERHGLEECTAGRYGPKDVASEDSGVTTFELDHSFCQLTNGVMQVVAADSCQCDTLS
jgi:hypothetical protein